MSDGPKRKPPASRSRTVPNTLGESMRGRHSHSTLPLGATRAVVSQSDRKAYSPMGGKGEPSAPPSGMRPPGRPPWPFVVIVRSPPGWGAPVSHVRQRPPTPRVPGLPASDIGFERVAGVGGACLEPDVEPLLALLGRAVRPSLGVDLPLRRLLDAVVADHGRGIEGLRDLFG